MAAPFFHLRNSEELIRAFSPDHASEVKRDR